MFAQCEVAWCRALIIEYQLVNGVVLILIILRDFMVHFFDMLRGYWKIVVAFNAKSGGRIHHARIESTTVNHDVVMYHIAMAHLERDAN